MAPMQRVGAVLAAAIAIAALAGCGSSYDGDPSAVALCNQLDENKQTAPDQIARGVYGNGAFAQAAVGIRATCPEEHGPVAIYMDDIANYDGTYELVAPPGYGTGMN